MKYSPVRLNSLGLFVLLTVPALLLSLFIGMAGAQAEENLADSAKDNKLGFKLGIVRLHPGLMLDMLWDSNVRNVPTAEVSDLVLHVQGGIKMNIPAENYALTLSGAVGYYKYFGIDNKNGFDSTNLDNLEARARLTMAFLKKAPVAFVVSDSFLFTQLPEGVTIFDVKERFNNNAKLDVVIQPRGPESTMKFILGYQNVLQHYTDSANENSNWLKHQVSLKAQWTFLPKTSIYLGSMFTIQDYYDFSADLSPIYASSPNAMPLDVRVGFIGRINPWLSLTASVGYFNAFSENLENLQTASAKAEGTFQVARRTQIRLGFTRDMSTVTVHGSMAANKVYINLKQLAFNDKFTARLIGSYQYQQFGKGDDDINVADVTNLNGKNRNDHLISLQPAVSYKFLPWISLALSYTLTYRDSDLEYTTKFTDANGVDSFITTNNDFTKHLVMLTFRMVY